MPNFIMTPSQIAQLKEARPGWCRRNWGRFTKSYRVERPDWVQLATSPVCFDLLLKVLRESLPEMVAILQEQNPKIEFSGE